MKYDYMSNVAYYNKERDSILKIFKARITHDSQQGHITVIFLGAKGER